MPVFRRPQERNDDSEDLDSWNLSASRGDLRAGAGSQTLSPPERRPPCGRQVGSPDKDGERQYTAESGSKCRTPPDAEGRTDIFGKGADYGKTVSGDAPVWRAGANATTRLTTEIPLTIGGKRVDAGSYAVFVELKEGAWTLVLSKHPLRTSTIPTTRPRSGARTVRPQVRRASRSHDDDHAQGVDRAVHDRLHRHDGHGRQARDRLGEDGRVVPFTVAS